MRREKKKHYCYPWLWVRWLWLILLSAKASGKLLTAQQNSINKDRLFSLLGTLLHPVFKGQVGKKKKGCLSTQSLNF